MGPPCIGPPCIGPPCMDPDRALHGPCGPGRAGPAGRGPAGRVRRGRSVRGKLRGTTGQLGRTHLRGLLLDRRSGYGGGDGRTGPVLLFGRLAHPLLLLLVLRGGTRRGGQLGAQILVLAKQARQFGLDLVEKGIDLVLVIAFSEADGRELLVPHVLGGQRHLFFTST